MNTNRFSGTHPRKFNQERFYGNPQQKGLVSGSKQGVKKQCSHCGKIGHIVDASYKKLGFPPGSKFKNTS